MAVHVSVKARVASADALLDAAQALSDDEHPQRIHQDETHFDPPHGRLTLRVFRDGSGELIHEPGDGGTKPLPVRAPVAEPESLRAVLALACGQLGRVRKQRVLVLVGTARINLDKVAGLGEFVEIEVTLQPGQSVADGEALAIELMARLGVAPSARVRGSYVELLRDAGAG